MSDLRPVEEEDFQEELDAAEEEEEEANEDLIVVDSEMMASLVSGIEAGTPVALAQAVDVILGFLGYKANVVLDEAVEESPLVSILPKLEKSLLQVYNKSKEGSTKREKVTALLEAVAAAVFDSCDKFQEKRGTQLFEILCECLFDLKEFGRTKIVRKVYLTCAKLGMTKDELRPTLFNLFDHMVKDEKYAASTLQILFRQLTTNASNVTIEKNLPTILEFFVKHKEEVTPFVKSLIKRVTAETMDSMAQKEKSVISWGALGTCQLAAQFIIQTEDKRFVYPFVTTLTALLKHFAVKLYLPFQLKIAMICHEISDKFDIFVPILSWVVDAIQFIVSCPCKGKVTFNCDAALMSPAILSFEFCHQALDRLKRLFLADIVRESKSIAFPEFVMPLKERLIEVVATAKNPQIAAETKTLIKVLSEQQSVLRELKKTIEWQDRREQVSLWGQEVDHVETPLNTLVDAHKKVEAKIAELKTPPKKEAQVDEATGDYLKVASVDDV